MGEVILLGRTQCQLGLTKGQRRARKNAIITGSLRTLVEFVRVVGRAFAQAWSEVESIRTERRSTNCCTEAGRRLEAVKPTHQLLKTAFKKREISRRCWRTISMRYVDKAMSGNEFNDRCRRLLAPLMFSIGV